MRSCELDIRTAWPNRADQEGAPLPLLVPLTLLFGIQLRTMDPSTVQALDMGLINTVVPLEQLQEETTVWCREILRNSPMALRVLKAALNAAVSPRSYGRLLIIFASSSPVHHI